MATDLVWDNDRIARYWDYWSTRTDRHSEYFSNKYGKAVAAFLNHVTPLDGTRCLDFGCGPGFLIDDLLAAGARVSAADTSGEAVRLVGEKYAGQRGWEGVQQLDDGPAPYPDDEFDVATCIETVEHVPEEGLGPLLSELRRLVRPGGTVLVTTPHEENLQFATMYCANCDHQFHWRQHLRSWTTDWLRRLLGEAGLDVVFCRGMSFKTWQPSRPRAADISPRMFGRRLRLRAGRLADRLSGRRFPDDRETALRLAYGYSMHLVAVARVPESAEGQ